MSLADVTCGEVGFPVGHTLPALRAQVRRIRADEGPRLRALRPHALADAPHGFQLWVRVSPMQACIASVACPAKKPPACQHSRLIHHVVRSFTVSRLRGRYGGGRAVAASTRTRWLRVQGVKRGSDTTLYSRYGRALTERYPVVVEAVRRVPCRPATSTADWCWPLNNGIGFCGLRGVPAPVTTFLLGLRHPGAGSRRLARPAADRALGTAGDAADTVRGPSARPGPELDDGQALLLACIDKGVEGIVSRLRVAPWAAPDQDDGSAIVSQDD